MADTTIYRITVLSVSQPISVGSASTASYAPWGGQGRGTPITFDDPELSEILIEDDDAVFSSQRYQGDDQQTVAETVHIGHNGSIEIPAGTRMSSFIGSIIQDDDNNQYFVVFPRTADPGQLGDVIGDRTAVLILPYLDGNPPQTHDVPFDPGKAYSFVRAEGGSNKMHIPYPPQSAPCFTTGTLIDTVRGPRPIETLRPGDMIRSRDRGLRVLRWIGAARLDRMRLELQPELRPIRIRAGALGPGLPERDLTVSPQHRVLVRSVIAERMFGQAENLVAAKHLTGMPGVGVAPADHITYWHLLFDRHEVVSSNGAWSESLFTGPQAMKSLGPAARREIMLLFPDLASPGCQPEPARNFLTGRQGIKLAERHQKNHRALVLDPA